MANKTRFETKKHSILRQLGVADDEYQDLSPKGSVDEPIRSLIDEINKFPGLVTTSSCSGRVSVFLEGKKKDASIIGGEAEDNETPSGPGGKGGGSWLYISHDPFAEASPQPGTELSHLFKLQRCDNTLEGSSRSHCRYIHFKFEPMILHVLTASMQDAQKVLTAALGAGFRESGAVSLNSSKSGDVNPMVAIRSTGYSLDAIVGLQNEEGENVALVNESYLRTLANIANERFTINNERIARFRMDLLQQYAKEERTQSDRPGWEDADIRRQRKREEGLARQRQMSPTPSPDADNMLDAGDIFDSR